MPMSLDCSARVVQQLGFCDGIFGDQGSAEVPMHLHIFTMLRWVAKGETWVVCPVSSYISFKHRQECHANISRGYGSFGRCLF